MDLISTHTEGAGTGAGTGAGITTGPDPIAELRRLRRQVQREQARRRAAESLGERATRDLYDSVRQLRSAQSELLERADRTRIVTELGRALRQDHDSEQLLCRAAESVALATGADRCDIFLVDPQPGTTTGGSHTVPGVRLPRPLTFGALPGSLAALLAGARGGALRIDDVDEDERLDPLSAADVQRLLGVSALVATPVALGTQMIGWIVMESVLPRVWEAGDLALCEDLSHDLVSSLVQVQAFERQLESVRRLQQLDEAKDAFISNVSHELRTPLTSIVGYLELIADGGMGELNPEQSAGLDIVQRNVARLRALVEDLLTLSAYDADAGPREGRPVDLAAIVVESLQSMRPTIASAGLEVELDVDPTVGDVTGDVMHYERVVSNLLSNAIKFTAAGGQIRVRIYHQRQMAVLVVSDTGIGIPDGEQERLFSRFFRSSLAVADEIQGTGLGLALVQSVVGSYGGTVGIESAVGVGTSVTVRLPLSAT